MKGLSIKKNIKKNKNKISQIYGYDSNLYDDDVNKMMRSKSHLETDNLLA